MPCPTLLTRDGHRIHGDGRFNSTVNQCPDDLGGREFTEHSDKLIELKKQIGEQSTTHAEKVHTQCLIHLFLPQSIELQQSYAKQTKYIL